MIKSVTIKVGKKDIVLSMKEVKELRKELNSLIEKEYITTPTLSPVYPYTYIPWTNPITYGPTTTSQTFDNTDISPITTCNN